MKRYLPFIIVGFVAAATLTSGVILYRINRPVALVIPKERVEKGDSKAAHIRGPENAKVTLEEFGDFQCPPCGMLAGPIKQIEEENASVMRVIFRNFPFPIHRHAVEAALAAEAAGRQGKFWEMHDLLYREQAAWTNATDIKILFSSYAGMIGLDLERFDKDKRSEEVRLRVENDRKLGLSIGIQTTPTILINNRPVPNTALSPDGLRQAIKEALNPTTPSG
jgi:protein-disulfide isomerase